MNFPGFAGNSDLKQYLSEQERKARLFHAYVLAGPPGSGKHTLAKILAAALVCSGGGTRPCGRCENCRKTFGGIHPDVIWCGWGEALLVEQTRAIRGDAFIRPNEAARKVYILEHAQEMSGRAQDVLLKLLEEGPDYASFLLLADNPAALLQTVRSRCEVLTLSPVGSREAEKALRARFPKAGRGELAAAAAACGGILGEAVKLLSGQGGREQPAQIRAQAFLQRLAGRRELALMEFAAGLEKCSREEFLAFLEAAVSLLRENLLRTAGFLPEKGPGEAGGLLSRRELMETISFLGVLRERCQGNVGIGHLSGLLSAGLWEAVFEAKEELI
ncbi:MAG: DNA polymerase III subunit delta [Oscillospiraceae bacterium]|nr:DNA polymerase III subunit delta [Oscillospiraceae bacterium]